MSNDNQQPCPSPDFCNCSEGGYDCAYCPLGGVGHPVMLDGYPAHPDCADALYGESGLAQVRAQVKEALTTNDFVGKKGEAR